MGWYRSICDDATKSLNEGIFVNGQPWSSAANMFRENNTFNQSIVIGNYVRSCYAMLYNCVNFNSPVVIGNNVVNCGAMFDNCRAFNQSVIIPNNVVYCVGMFSYCTNFNLPVTIPDRANLNSIRMMFSGCVNFNQNITIPSNITDCYRTFAQPYNFCKNIYFKGKTFRNINVNGLVQGKYSSVRINIWFNSILNNQFNLTNNDSVVGNSVTSTPLSWTTMTNGFYSSAYSIYCYTNYAG